MPIFVLQNDMAVEKNEKKSVAESKKGRARGKEIEIPVVVINKKSTADIPLKTKSDDFIVSGPKIVKDEEDLPIFENKDSKIKSDVSGKEYLVGEDKIFVKGIDNKKDTSDTNFGVARVTAKRSEIKQTFGAAIERKKIEKASLMDDPKRKETVFVVSVVLIVSLIFFVWVAILKNNLSFSLGPQNPFTFDEAEETLNKFHQSLDDARAEWTKLESTIEEQKKAEAANQEVVDKIKEKIVSGEAEVAPAVDEKKTEQP